ncbi:MAG: hypothetical protein JO060_04670 [Candidatus Eremiobacteraeota bacterium]|nr:hypothetical protein [Candidatus Eremiobacteraeota bacterium]MBV9646785.1 hypothetical protein [Candidatus Eremiobacteraeota bacterium]
MKRLPLTEYLLKLAQDADARDTFRRTSERERKAHMKAAGLDEEQQAALLSGDRNRCMHELQEELREILPGILAVDHNIMQHVFDETREE